MSPETTILLVRHGETEWNRQRRLQGNQDTPLTENGIRQAQKASKELQPFCIHHAHVSPLKRARDTMAIILRDRELDVAIKDKLREINLGPWEGKTREETALSHPQEYKAFWERPDLFNLSGADTFKQLQSRIIDELEGIFSTGKNKNHLVVSHWIAIKVALAHYSNIPLKDLSHIVDPANGGYLCLVKGERTVEIRCS